NAAAVCLNCTIINDGEHQYIENGDWGFINKSGEIIVPLIYEGVLDSFVNGVAVVKKDGNDLRINKSGEIIKMESKDFTGWVELLADQMILTNKLYGNQSTGINILWDAVRESFVLDYYDHGILQITFSDKQRRLSLIHYTVIPWQNVREYKIGNELQDPIMMQNILTVTDYAIILYSEDAAVNNDEDKELVSRFHEAFKKVINFEENQNEVDELSIELPNTVQVISLKEYQNYINLEFAEPGSDMSFINEIGNLSDRKMIYLTITPEIGPVKRMWVKPDNPFIDTYYLSVEKNLLDLFKSAIHKSITDIDKRVEIFHGAIEKLRELFNAANSYVNLLFERYENRLSDWLFCSESQAINYPGDKNIFTDYQPKKTPDTIIDFMPQLSEEFEQLPSSDLNNLIPLINLFIKYEKLAETNPGEWYEGNIILGAKEREYLPSKEELILSEIGNRINQITQINNSFTIKQMIKSANISLDRLNYKEYTVIHYDVMGSGRFFYIEEIINKIVSF
ncbi:MAG: WG repeat-containing protein, partial [Melioribacteraceae bacterium]|nr:WG repeat-containing protein [Melioribacteraceae bacterium]